MIIAIATHDPLKILVKLMTGTVNGDPLKSFKQHSKILKDHLQEPLPDLKNLTFNIRLFIQFRFILLHLRYLLSVIIQQQ